MMEFKQDFIDKIFSVKHGHTRVLLVVVMLLMVMYAVSLMVSK